MTRTMRRYGFRVLTADDAATAAAVARSEPVDLILTEAQLPTFDTLLARVRELPADRRAPVVIVNPDALPGTRYGDALVLTDFAQLRTLLITK